MANVKKANRVQDTDIKRLNHVGLGLKAIADLLGCHAATVTLRLKAMGVDPTDTRRSFMEQVFLSLTPDEQEWLSHNLYNSGTSIKEFTTRLIKEAYAQAPVVAAPTPPPMPEMTVGSPQIDAAIEKLKQDGSLAEVPADDADLKVDPEYVSDSLQTAICGSCYENPVEEEGQLCVGCQVIPATKTASVFG